MQLQFFPSRQLALYVGRTFIVRCFAVLMMLVIVLTTLDLLGESKEILMIPGNGEAELWRYASLRIPQLVSRFLPFSVLLGTIITLVTMNQHSEIVSMKAAGLSAHQILAPLIIAAMGIAIISFVFNERIVTRSTATLNTWQAVQYGIAPKETGIKMNVWVRDGNNLVTAGIIGGQGNAVQLRFVEMFNRINNKLTNIVRARKAYYDPNTQDWVLEDARLFDVARGTSRDMGTIHAARGVRPNQFTLAKIDPDGLSIDELRRTISDLRDAGRPTAELEATLWHKFSGPLSALLMPLLGAVAAFGLARSGQLFLRAVMGMALGFAYFVVDNFSLAMGNLGAYPPFLAAWAPFFLFFLLGEAVLLRSEE
jgi:lipopolysaccharide export system permease protein